MNPIIPLYKQADRLIVRSKDCYVYDSENREYIDFESGDWAANLGHSNSHINSVIKTQIDKLIHDGLRFRSNESELLSIFLQAEDGIRDLIVTGVQTCALPISVDSQLSDFNHMSPPQMYGMNMS